MGARGTHWGRWGLILVAIIAGLILLTRPIGGMADEAYSPEDDIIFKDPQIVEWVRQIDGEAAYLSRLPQGPGLAPAIRASLDRIERILDKLQPRLQAYSAARQPRPPAPTL